jgi:hypothetical protein
MISKVVSVASLPAPTGAVLLVVTGPLMLRF